MRKTIVFVGALFLAGAASFILGVGASTTFLNLRDTDQTLTFRSYVDAPLGALIGQDGNIECYVDDYGNCGKDGNVLMLDDIGKRVWRPIGGPE